VPLTTPAETVLALTVLKLPVVPCTVVPLTVVAETVLADTVLKLPVVPCTVVPLTVVAETVLADTVLKLPVVPCTVVALTVPAETVVAETVVAETVVALTVPAEMVLALTVQVELEPARTPPISIGRLTLPIRGRVAFSSSPAQISRIWASAWDGVIAGTANTLASRAAFRTSLRPRGRRGAESRGAEADDSDRETDTWTSDISRQPRTKVRLVQARQPSQPQFPQ
jgi:hypothetical protein